MHFTSKVVKFGCAGLLLTSLVLFGWGCAKQGELPLVTPSSSEQEEQEPVVDLGKEQMFSAAREYVKKYSAEGMMVDLEVIEQLDKWVLLRVIPLNIETDVAAIVLEKVGEKWVAREFGTILPESTERVPELFE